MAQHYRLVYRRRGFGQRKVSLLGPEVNELVLLMCLGLNFAYMQAKGFSWHFFNNVRVSVGPDYPPEWRMWPIPYPRDGSSVTLSPV